MWKWLHPYAKPEAAYHLSGKFLPWFSVLVPRMPIGWYRLGARICTFGLPARR